MQFNFRQWLVFTQEYTHLAHFDMSAEIWVSAEEVYEGIEPMPMVRHPYYTMCNRLKIYFRENREMTKRKWTKTEHNKLTYLFEDLFWKDLFFPNLEELEIKQTHSFETNHIGRKSWMQFQYQYLFNSPFLRNLKKLKIYDDSLNVFWRWIKLLSSDLMPNLKEVEVPLQSIVGTSKARVAETSSEFEGTVKLFCTSSHCGYFDACSKSHYFKNWEKDPSTILKDLTFFNTKKLSIKCGDNSQLPPIFSEQLKSIGDSKMSGKHPYENFLFTLEKLHSYSELDLENTSISSQFFIKIRNLWDIIRRK